MMLLNMTKPWIHSYIYSRSRRKCFFKQKDCICWVFRVTYTSKFHILKISDSELQTTCVLKNELWAEKFSKLSMEDSIVIIKINGGKYRYRGNSKTIEILNLDFLSLVPGGISGLSGLNLGKEVMNMPSYSGSSEKCRHDIGVTFALDRCILVHSNMQLQRCKGHLKYDVVLGVYFEDAGPTISQADALYKQDDGPLKLLHKFSKKNMLSMPKSNYLELDASPSFGCHKALNRFFEKMKGSGEITELRSLKFSYHMLNLCSKSSILSIIMGIISAIGCNNYAPDSGEENEIYVAHRLYVWISEAERSYKQVRNILGFAKVVKLCNRSKINGRICLYMHQTNPIRRKRVDYTDKIVSPHNYTSQFTAYMLRDFVNKRKWVYYFCRELCISNAFPFVTNGLRSQII